LSTPESSERLGSFEAFWPFYVGEHRSPTNRGLHYAGTTGVIGLLTWAILSQTWWVFAILPLCGYGFAWYGHFIVEKNRPATFTYPLWSLMGDFKMFGLAMTGRMRGEVVRLYGSQHPAPDAPLLVTK
jgi:hypothetical protein